VTKSDIIYETAKAFSVNPGDLVSRKKPSGIMPARFALYAIFRRRGASYPQAARWCNRKDHSTIMYGVERANYIMEVDSLYRETIERISSMRASPLDSDESGEPHIRHTRR
jgi:chromosomal replication initiation ATPase DnaA